MRRGFFQLFLAAGLLCGGCRVPPLPRMLEHVSKEEKNDPVRAHLTVLAELTLHAAQEIALRDHPSIAVARSRVMAARFRYFEQSGAYLPEITFSYALGQSVTDRDGMVNPLSTTPPYENSFSAGGSFRAGWLLFDGLSRLFDTLAAAEKHTASAARFADVQRLLRRAVAYAFYDLLLAESNTAIARSDLAFRNSCLDEAEVRFRAGFISRSELLALRIDAARVRTHLVASQAAIRSGRAALAALLGCSSGTLPPRLRLVMPELSRQPLPAVETYLLEALRHRPDLAALAAEYRAAVDHQRAGWGAFLPQIRIYGLVGYASQLTRFRGFDFQHSYENAFSYEYGAAASWDLFRGGRDWNEYRRRGAMVREERSRFSALELQILSEVEAAWAERQAAAEIAGKFDAIRRDAATERELVRQEFFSGFVTVTRLRGAQNDLVGAECALASSLIALGKADARLEAAVDGSIRREQPAVPQLVPGLHHYLQWQRENVQ